MAFGFSAKHAQDINLDNLSPEHFLTIAIEAAKAMGWKIGVKTENSFLAYTSFSMTSYGEKITVAVSNGIVNIKSECSDHQLIDWGKNKKNIALLVSKIEALKTSISTDELLLKAEALKPTLVGEGALHQQNSFSSSSKKDNPLSFLIPSEGYFITPILIYLNVLIFVIMVINGVDIMDPDSESLILWGANFRPSTLAGEWWRLLTCCFIHIGIFHLLMNMYALLYIGSLLEPHLGKLRFLGAYLLTGILASVTSLWWHDFTASAGASGAIFGMYGVFAAMLTTNLIEKEERDALLTSTLVFIGYNLLNGIRGGIDNAAHIGGLIGGVMIGYAFIPGLKKQANTQSQLSLIGILTLVVLTVSSVVCLKLPNDIANYDAKIQQLVSLESIALEVYKLPEGTSKEKMLYELKNKGIVNWKESIKLIDEADQLDIPEEIHLKNSRLRTYCELRLKTYELLYKAAEENTDQYQTQIDDYGQQVEKIVNELNANATPEE